MTGMADHCFLVLAVFGPGRWLPLQPPTHFSIAARAGGFTGLARGAQGQAGHASATADPCATATVRRVFVLGSATVATLQLAYSHGNFRAQLCSARI
jgi:hypothetical protein